MSKFQAKKNMKRRKEIQYRFKAQIKRMQSFADCLQTMALCFSKIGKRAPQSNEGIIHGSKRL